MAGEVYAVLQVWKTGDEYLVASIHALSLWNAFAVAFSMELLYDCASGLCGKCSFLGGVSATYPSHTEEWGGLMLS
jgi:hypothetical protein